MRKRFAVLAVGVLAIVAVIGAVAAESHAANFTASGYPVSVTAEGALGNDVIKTEAGNIECKSHFAGSLGSSSSILALNPTYSLCKAFGFLSASVGFGDSCEYRLQSPFSPSNDATNSLMEIQCLYFDVLKGEWVEYPIVVTAGTCEMKIKSQFSKTRVNFTVNTAAGDLSMQFAVTGINYEVTKDGFGCPFGGVGAKTGATYTMGSAVTLDSTGGQTIDIG